MTYRIIESLCQNTCLGIRFWDTVTNSYIRDYLRVTAYSVTAPRKVRYATRNGSGVYAFNHLPGLREIEQSSEDDFFVASPHVSETFVVEVRDVRGDFLNVGFMVDLPLPYRGVYLSDQLGSPQGGIPKGFNLYSTVKRTPPPMMAAIRADLVDADTDKPAAHAVVCVEIEDGFQWYGISDTEGKVVVLMPYPMLADRFASPPVAGLGTLAEQSWPLAVAVRYNPGLVETLPFSTLVDYASVLHQNTAAVWLEKPAVDVTPVDVVSVPLRYGKDVVLKTEGQSTLIVTPVASPPS